MQNRGDKKRFLRVWWGMALLIGLVLAVELSAAPVSAQATFTDVQGKEWFAADVMALAANSNEIIKGYPDG
ncbi:S-layer homology domain-containing protein, partial [Clostridiales bacterium COT073_COT-073]